MDFVLVNAFKLKNKQSRLVGTRRNTINTMLGEGGGGLDSGVGSSSYLGQEVYGSNSRQDAITFWTL